MRSVRQKNTAPELAVRHLLHKMGYRFRLHLKAMPGTPDIVLPKWRTAIFVNGCFWHGHSCPLGKLPGTRTGYWIPKIAQNRERDEAKSAQLAERGWNVVTIWQCEIRDEAKLIASLTAALRPRLEPDR
jgi:DNA mismatch endonuclease, patch repair protein